MKQYIIYILLLYVLILLSYYIKLCNVRKVVLSVIILCVRVL